MTSIDRHRPRNVKAVGTFAVLLAIGLASLGAQNPADPAIKTTVRAAIADVRDAATYKTPNWSNGRLDAANVRATHDRLAKSMNAHFTEAGQAHWKQILDVAIDRDSDGDHVVVTAGGVDQIQFDTVSVTGDHASVSGRAHTWVTWRIIKPDFKGARTGHPTGWEAFDATLVQVDGKWLVDQLNLAPQGV
jgi:hypothetical protein